MDVESVIDQVSQYFPHTAEANLCLAIVERALRDITDPQVTEEVKQDAMDYLAGDIVHAKVYDVHPRMIRSILAEAALMPSEWELKKRGIAIE